MEIDELQAGRELDALVAEEVMSWHSITRWADGEISGRHKQADHQLIELPHYSTDIAAAWEVVEKLQLQCGYAYEGGRPFAMKGIELVVYAETVSLAICKAALKVVGCSVS